MSKNILLLIISLFVGVFAKKNYLPPLMLENIISEKVSEFLEENLKDGGLISKQIRRDVLGRYQGNTNYPRNYVLRDEPQMDVHIVYLGNHRDINTSFGRFEISQKDSTRIWLNGLEMSKETYDLAMERQVNEHFVETGYRASLTAKQIKNILSGPQKIYISEDLAPKTTEYRDYNVIFNISQIVTYAHENSYKGHGTAVYFFEKGCSPVGRLNQDFYINGDSCVNNESVHALAVAKILQTVAPEAKIIGFNQVNLPNPNLTNPKIEIGSHSWATNTSGIYTSDDSEFDNYIYDNRIIMFVAAGNKNDSIGDYWVSSPGKSLNSITVGAVDPVTDNYMAYSMWKNSNVANQKPEIANYTDFYFPNEIPFTDVAGNSWNGYFGGTSASTPYSAGIAADILSQHSFFKGHPELFKALLLSGEKRAINNASFYDVDNNTIAAMGVSRYSSLAWNHRLRYWNGGNTCCFDSDNKITFVENDIVANTHYRIAIAWLTSGDYVALNHSLSQDIDLRVYQNGRLLAYSISSENPFEVVDFVTSSNADLTIEILRYANAGSDNVILGYSLWNDF